MACAAGRSAGGTSLLSMAIAVLLTALTGAQLRSLDKAFVCPETLSNDAARLQAMTNFMQDHARFDPDATVNDRLAFHQKLLRRHRCASDGDANQYSFPQT